MGWLKDSLSCDHASEWAQNNLLMHMKLLDTTRPFSRLIDDLCYFFEFQHVPLHSMILYAKYHVKSTIMVSEDRLHDASCQKVVVGRRLFLLPHHHKTKSPRTHYDVSSTSMSPMQFYSRATFFSCYLTKSEYRLWESFGRPQDNFNHEYERSDDGRTLGRENRNKIDTPHTT
jgi:hypothetical protein